LHVSRPTPYLTPQQLDTLYCLLKENCYLSQIYRLQTLVTLLHRTGARISEVLALNLEGINLEERKFKVLGKGNKQRWCFYSEDVAINLARYLKYYRHQEHPALFTAQQPLTKEVTRLSYRTAYRDRNCIIAKSPELQGWRK
jgi:integrase/recombinase XerD